MDKVSSRRDFLKKSTVLGTAAIAGMSAIPHVHAAGSDVFKLGIIGCGGRGRGAVINSLTGNPNVKLYAMGELFKDRGLSAREALQSAEIAKGRIDVPDSRLFNGFDNYKGVIEAADIVLIACASRFHPFYAMEAVKAGKHVFVEKPHGIDAAGVHQILDAAKIAEKNKTAFVSGLCYRYDLLRREAIARMKEGMIGDITAVQSDYIRSPYSLIKREEGWSEFEYQFRNWYHFTWLTGDEILQSLLHNLDSVLWALNEELPESCYGVGGRSSTFIPELGDIFDHTAIIYNYADGKRIYGATRAAVKCYTSNTDVFHGTKGRCFFQATGIPWITDLKGKEIWRPEKELRVRDMYVQEHYELVQSVMAQKPINDGERMAHSSMVAVLGMVASRCGKLVNYKELFDSKFKLQPTIDNISFDSKSAAGPRPDGLYNVPIPGEFSDFQEK